MQEDRDLTKEWRNSIYWKKRKQVEKAVSGLLNSFLGAGGIVLFLGAQHIYSYQMHKYPTSVKDLMPIHLLSTRSRYTKAN